MSGVTPGGTTSPGLLAPAGQPVQPVGFTLFPMTCDDPFTDMVPFVVTAPFALIVGIPRRSSAPTRFTAVRFVLTASPDVAVPVETSVKVSLLRRVRRT